MLRLKDIDGQELSILAAAIANAISPEFETEELILLSDVLAAVGVNLSVIAAQRTALKVSEDRNAAENTNAMIADLRRRLEDLESGAR